jgi:hypothetical protein
MDYAAFAQRIKDWGRELGFQAVGIAHADLSAAEPRLLDWLDRGWHGEMEYMARNTELRSNPASLKPGTLRVISCRMDYLHDIPASLADELKPGHAYIARYARGRDYHKVLRARLQKLCERIEAESGPFGYRVFTDSAPVLEVELAAKAGIGWRGKHTLLLSRDAGSWFFLGEIYCDLPLPADREEENRCGSCQRCIDVWMPVAASRISPSSTRAQFRKSCARSSATASTAATTASWYARGTASRKRAAKRISRYATGSTAPRWWSSSRGPKPSSTSACAARRSGASATSAGCATSRSAWATRPPHRT